MLIIKNNILRFFQCCLLYVSFDLQNITLFIAILKNEIFLNNILQIVHTLHGYSIGVTYRSPLVDIGFFQVAVLHFPHPI